MSNPGMLNIRDIKHIVSMPIVSIHNAVMNDFFFNDRN